MTSHEPPSPTQLLLAYQLIAYLKSFDLLAATRKRALYLLDLAFQLVSSYLAPDKYVPA
jgi:hypothetical protein